jgi:hypothetical protein
MAGVHTLAAWAAASAAAFVYGIYGVAVPAFNRWGLARWAREVQQDSENQEPPQGHLMFGGEFKALSKDFEGYIFLDEVYRRLMFDDEREVFQLCLAHIDQIVAMSQVTTSLTKSDALDSEG